MDAISITKEKKTKDGWLFLVVIRGKESEKKSEKEYEVSVTDGYWRKLTAGNITPADFVKKSFVFLLEREPKESILSKFDLRKIQQYFPEYERAMRDS